MQYGLGVDLGTTQTAAAVRDPDGRIEVVRLGGRRAEIPSLVFVRPDGTLLIGEPAERRGQTEPARLAREFKRRIGDPVPILVGGAPFSAHALTAKLLRHVLDSVGHLRGGPPAAIVVTHPANWGPYKREQLDQAIRLADAGPVQVRSEPEAAALQHATARRIAPGETVAVYDLGGGTFDVAVLRRDADGFALLGEPEGIEQLGGIDFDEAVFGHVLGVLGPMAEGMDPADDEVVSALSRLRRDCVEAKEALSFDTETMIPVALPGLHTRVRLNRSELESMIAPSLADTVAATRRAFRGAGVTPDQVSVILLAGGSSRIPLVAELLSTEFQRPVIADPHPEHSIAMGAAVATAVVLGGGSATPPATTPAGATAAPGRAGPPPTTQPAQAIPPARVSSLPAASTAPMSGVPAASAAPGSGTPHASTTPASGARPPSPAPGSGTAPAPRAWPAGDEFAAGRGGEPPAAGQVTYTRGSASVPGAAAGTATTMPLTAATTTPMPLASTPGAPSVPTSGAPGIPTSATPPGIPTSGAPGIPTPGTPGAGIPWPPPQPEPRRPTRKLVVAGAAAAVLLVAGGTAAILARTRDDNPSPRTAAPAATTAAPPTTAATTAPAAAPFPSDAMLVRVDTGAASSKQRVSKIHTFTPGVDTPRTPLKGTQPGDTLPKWSHDREEIAVTHISANRNDIYLMSADGSNRRKILEGVAYSRVAWSADDQKLAYVRNKNGVNQIFVQPLDDSDSTQLTFGDDPKDDPAWSADGKSIIYWRVVGGVRQIFELSVDDPVEPGRLIVGPGNGPANDPMPSPDGTKVLYTRESTTADPNATDIWIIDADGTNPRRLTSDPVREMDPSWSPDGTWFAFVRGPYDKPAVVLMRPDGSGETVLTRPGAREGHVCWF